MKLEKLAKGMDCMVRLPGVCNFNPETTVLAHFRMAGLCGTGIKPPSLIAAWSCSSCHDEIDRRTRLLEGEFVHTAFLEGVIRTQYELIRKGVIK